MYLLLFGTTLLPLLLSFTDFCLWESSKLNLLFSCAHLTDKRLIASLVVFIAILRTFFKCSASTPASTICLGTINARQCEHYWCWPLVLQTSKLRALRMCANMFRFPVSVELQGISGDLNPTRARAGAHKVPTSWFLKFSLQWRKIQKPKLVTFHKILWETL